MKLPLVGTGRYLCKVYNYHDSRTYGYKQYGIFFWLDGMVWDGWNDFGIDHVDWCDPLWSLFGSYFEI
jgi:hypothetical protein